MSGRLFLVLLLVGVCSCQIGSQRHQPQVEQMAQMVKDPQDRYAIGGLDHLQEAMDELWEKYTNFDDLPPTFFSPKFNKNIQGKNMVTNIYERPIFAWQGIQFGKPATKDNGLRFKPTVRSDLYDTMEDDPLLFDHLGFKCPQGAMIGHGPTGSEDCLYLNVYTPYLPGQYPNGSLPVMLFIHGGAFTSGDASMYLPTKLLNHDVILVTIHYRMGAFGFFNLNNEDAPGNPALYDMVESIKWTNEFIADFGGDPKRLTVFGESAGSVSANYMLLLPAVKDYVNGIICESGSTLEVWALDPNPREAAEYIADWLGCEWQNDSELFLCVEAADQDDLVSAQGSLVGTDRHNALMGFRGAAPSIQTYQGDTWDPLLIKHPREYFIDRELNDVPLLIGANKQEGSFVLGIMYWDYFMYWSLLENSTWMNNEMIPTIMHSFGIDDITHALSSSFEKLYCSGVDITDFDAVAPCLIDMVGVMFLKSGAWENANMHHYYSNNQKTFFYSFDFTSDDSMYIWLLGAPPFDPGVTHSDELMYLFSMPAIMEGKQILTMDRMTLLWTNFATYGDPTPSENDKPWMDLGIEKWLEFDTDDHHFMLMRDNFTHDIREYTSRWGVTMEELRGQTDYGPSWQEYNELEVEKDEQGEDYDHLIVENEQLEKDYQQLTLEEHTIEEDYSSLEAQNEDLQRDYDRVLEENAALKMENDDISTKSDTYMIVMVVFVCLFVVSDAAAVYFYLKTRG